VLAIDRRPSRVGHTRRLNQLAETSVAAGAARRAIQRSGLPHQKIDAVATVGGSARIPVRSIVNPRAHRPTDRLSADRPAAAAAAAATAIPAPRSWARY
jgi:3-oxoacyl-[acyl-carrier-protein] synthase III